VKVRRLDSRSAIAKFAIVGTSVLVLLLAWFSIRWHFANAIAGNFDKRRPESKVVADWLVGIAPSDPLTHYAAALVYEGTFDAKDLERSVREYEASAAAAPHSYKTWLNLGLARSNTGDDAGAERAFRRALDLAPNYSAVQWAYGNFLVRTGREKEGFAFISNAAKADEKYAVPAASVALQVFAGDMAGMRSAMGDNETTNAALAAVLSGQGKYGDAVAAWQMIPPAARQATSKAVGDKLVDHLIVAKEFRLAAQVAADLATSEALRPAVGQISNGGFESEVKLRDAGHFEWKVADGAHPQVGLSPASRHSGQYSLSMIFNSSAVADFRLVSQMVPIEPGRRYEIEFYYQSDLRSPSGTLKWEVAHGGTTAALGASPPLVPTSEWSLSKVSFTAPSDVDAVIIRLAREGCGSVTCQMTGKIGFDDFVLRRLQ
jgi:tetratricopeptide (TPR) repeat protein